MPVSRRLLFTPVLVLFGSPGRLFAATELKTTYDIKLENTAPSRSFHIGSSTGANPMAKVMFRKRGRYGGAQ
jgi:hypothetical protein